MAFAYTKTQETVFGNKKVIWGTFTNGGSDTGGDIETGLTNCDGLIIQQTGSAVTTGAPVVNETFPVAGGSITVVTDADADGVWYAWGY